MSKPRSLNSARRQGGTRTDLAGGLGAAARLNHDWLARKVGSLRACQPQHERKARGHQPGHDRHRATNDSASTTRTGLHEFELWKEPREQKREGYRRTDEEAESSEKRPLVRKAQQCEPEAEPAPGGYRSNRRHQIRSRFTSDPPEPRALLLELPAQPMFSHEHPAWVRALYEAVDVAIRAQHYLHREGRNPAERVKPARQPEGLQVRCADLVEYLVKRARVLGVELVRCAIHANAEFMVDSLPSLRNVSREPRLALLCGPVCVSLEIAILGLFVGCIKVGV